MSVTVTKYNTELHKNLLDQWLYRWNLSLSDDRLLSDIGLVVDSCVLGFLYSTPSKQFYIDRVISDPSISKEKRNKALSTLFTELEKIAKERGAIIVTALADMDSMRNRFLEHSYNHFGEFGLYYKEL